MRMKTVGNKRDLIAVVIYNEDAASIPIGAPVVLNSVGSNDGLGVVLPSTATDASQSSLAFGVSMGTYASSTYGEAQIFGACTSVKLMRTRAASTDSFASLPAFLLLKAESVNNSFVTVASNGASAFIPGACLLKSVASIASTAASSATMATSLVVGFLRMM